MAFSLQWLCSFLSLITIRCSGSLASLASNFKSIPCSVGGADYGSVRIGTFLGRKMIKSMASEISSYSLANGNSDWQVCAMNSDEMEKDGRELLEVEASLDYLCNLSPHR